MMRRPKVLIIDDRLEDILRAERCLEAECECISARDGISGLSIIRDCVPDLVLLDIDLESGPDGFEVLRRIRAERIKVPVFMYTNHEKESYRLRATELGAQGYIMKTQSAHLCDSLRAALHLGRQ